MKYAVYVTRICNAATNGNLSRAILNALSYNFKRPVKYVLFNNLYMKKADLYKALNCAVSRIYPYSKRILILDRKWLEIKKIIRVH